MAYMRCSHLQDEGDEGGWRQVHGQASRRWNGASTTGTARDLGTLARVEHTMGVLARWAGLTWS
jgi:hypothetical protein